MLGGAGVPVVVAVPPDPSSHAMDEVAATDALVEAFVEVAGPFRAALVLVVVDVVVEGVAVTVNGVPAV